MKTLFFCLIAFATHTVAFTRETATGGIVVCGFWENRHHSATVGGNSPAITVFEKHHIPDFGTHQIRHEICFKQDSFYMTIPLTKNLQYLQFSRFTWDGRYSVDESKLSAAFYLVKPGDSIHISRPAHGQLVISSDNPLINYQYQLFALLNSITWRAHPSNFSDALNAELQQMETNLSKGDSLGAYYRPVIDPYLFSIIELNFRSYVQSSVCQRFYIGALNSDQDSLNTALLQHFTDVFCQHERQADNGLLDASFKYLEFLFYLNSAKGALKARMEGIVDTDNRQMATVIYRMIVDNNQGYTRDQLLSMFFKWSVNIRLLGEDAAPLVGDALGKVQNGEIQKELSQKLVMLTGGERVPDVELFDVDGNKVSIGDFGGKVVMAHFWFLGCLPCMELNRNLAPLIKKYSDHPDIVFLNINVDRRRESWQVGLQSGNYSHPEEITLYTGPEGMTHPLIKHYGYIGMPSLLLLDRKGLLISAQPPRGDTSESFYALEALIKKSLDIKKP